MLVDCQIPSDSPDGIPPAVICLEEAAERRGGCYDIDLLCITHPDRDHYRGMTYVIDWVEQHGGTVKNLILFASPHLKSLKARVKAIDERLQAEGKVSRTSVLPKRGKLRQINREFVELYKRLVKTKKRIMQEGGYFRAANGFAHFKDFGEASVYILGPTSQTVETHLDRVLDEFITASLAGDEDGNASTNEISCLLWIVIGNAKILLTGDTTAAAWSGALQSYEHHHQGRFRHELPCDIVKAPHHGAKTSSVVEIWQKVLKPESSSVAISAGIHKGYGHPHQETLEHIREAHPQTQLFCTNICPMHREPQIQPVPPLMTERTFWEDDSWTADGRSQTVEMKDNKYHGHCSFEIATDGVIIPHPERNPSRICRYHKNT